MASKILLVMKNDYNQKLYKEFDLGYNCNATMIEILSKRGVDYSELDVVIDKLLKGEKVRTSTGYRFEIKQL